MREYLINLRKNKKLTQQQVADALKISRAFYGLIEQGKRNPTLLLANKIAKYFGEDVNLLFFNHLPNNNEKNLKIVNK